MDRTHPHRLPSCLRERVLTALVERHVIYRARALENHRSKRVQGLSSVLWWIDERALLGFDGTYRNPACSDRRKAQAETALSQAILRMPLTRTQASPSEARRRMDSETSHNCCRRVGPWAPRSGSRYPQPVICACCSEVFAAHAPEAPLSLLEQVNSREARST